VVKYLFEKDGYENHGSMALLFVTSPFRTVADIVEAKNIYDKGHDSLLSITKYSALPQFALQLEDGGQVKPWYSYDFFNKITTKQKIQELYYPNYMIQMADRSVVMAKNGFMGDHCGRYIIEAERAVDIDTKLDFRWAQYLVESGEIHIDEY